MMRAPRAIVTTGLVTCCVLGGGLLFSAVPALAVAPEAPLTSSPATSITGTSAVLEGTLNPHANAKAGWYFAYNQGLSCAGGATTVQEPEVQGEALIAHAAVEGLEPSRRYTFCLVAINELGETTQSANEATFETSALAPTVEGLTAVGVSSAVGRLEALVNAENQPPECKFEYGRVSAVTLETSVPCEQSAAT